MEDILASIKRIIADDGVAPGAGQAAHAEAVLELTEPVAPPPPPAPAPRMQAAPPAPAPVPQAAAPLPVDMTGAAGLVSLGAASASRQSLSALSSLVLRAPGQDNTLDGLVRDMLRPMLKEWLDAHLPAIVEGLVAREIARITQAG